MVPLPQSSGHFHAAVGSVIRSSDLLKTKSTTLIFPGLHGGSVQLDLTKLFQQ